MSFLSNSITYIPAYFAILFLSPECDAAVPLYGIPMPKASVKQFMLFAVKRPEHEPHPGQEFMANVSNSSSLTVPSLHAPTPSIAELKSYTFPFFLPGSIGPPLTTILGILSLAAAINIPGTILSQLGISTKASKPCAIAITSIESAINSLEARE